VPIVIPERKTMKQLSNKSIRKLVRILQRNGIPAVTGDQMKKVQRCRPAKKS
jgi:hypothetical protein